MSNTKRHWTCVIGAATFWLLAAPATAQTTGSWEVQLELLRMDVKGADRHTGDVVRLTETQTLNPPQISDRVTHTPIDLDMDAKKHHPCGVETSGPNVGSRRQRLVPANRRLGVRPCVECARVGDSVRHHV
jgi:hypothetical protein